MDRLLRSFELDEGGRGRRAYVAWLEARAANNHGDIDPVALAALRRGWYLGEESFRDRLLDFVEKAKGVKPRQRRKPGGPERDHGEMDAGRIVRQLVPHLGLPSTAQELGDLRKGDPRKALLAAVLKARTAVGADWIAKRLAMGHPGSVSRQIGKVKRDRKLQKQAHELGKMLPCEDCGRDRRCRRPPAQIRT